MDLATMVSVSKCQVSRREWPSNERACPESEMMVVWEKNSQV